MKNEILLTPIQIIEKRIEELEKKMATMREQGHGDYEDYQSKKDMLELNKKILDKIKG